MFMKKLLKKLGAKYIVTILLLLLAGSGILYDFLRSKTFRIEMLSMTPEVAVADSRLPVTITVRVSRRGEPCQNHYLYVINNGGGQLKGNRILTDADGMAEIIYYPYTESMVRPAGPVTISIKDESNSVFFEIGANLSFVIELQSKGN